MNAKQLEAQHILTSTQLTSAVCFGIAFKTIIARARALERTSDAQSIRSAREHVTKDSWNHHKE
jgi:hypothetical protein